MSNLNTFYGVNADIKKCTDRIENIKNTFKNDFLVDCSDVFSSSGRIEILGNHTDHNKGNVLVGAIDQDIIAASLKRNDDLVVIKSQGFEDISINIHDTIKRENEKGKSISLVRGVLQGLLDGGYKIGGISAALKSNVFKGAGVSSSAAYEVLLCKIFSYYYCNDDLSPLILARISQFAESEYFGKPCGLLDQSGIAYGGVNHIDFTDTKNPIITTLKPDFKGYNIVITNCGGDHSNLTPEYSAIKNDMHAVSSFFGMQYLREVPSSLFYNSLPQLKEKLGGRAMIRAIHFYEENTRVDTAKTALLSGDMQTFLKMVNLSGESSYKLLQNCYAQGDSYQGIPLALELSKQFLKGEGAVRVHGGGFAGTIIAFVPDNITNSYIDFMQSVFNKENVLKLNLRNIGVAKLEI